VTINRDMRGAMTFGENKDITRNQYFVLVFLAVIPCSPPHRRPGGSTRRRDERKRGAKTKNRKLTAATHHSATALVSRARARKSIAPFFVHGKRIERKQKHEGKKSGENQKK
jgi:hypothetical protein